MLVNVVYGCLLIISFPWTLWSCKRPRKKSEYFVWQNTKAALRQIILAATPDFTFLQNIYFCNLYEKMSSLVSERMIVCIVLKKHLFLRNGIFQVSTLLNFDPKICCLIMNVADSVSKYLDQWSLNSKPYFWLDVYFKARDDLWLLGLLLFHPKNPWRIINFKDQ